jgi:hypothetical protein
LQFDTVEQRAAIGRDWLVCSAQLRVLDHGGLHVHAGSTLRLVRIREIQMRLLRDIPELTPRDIEIRPDFW